MQDPSTSLAWDDVGQDQPFISISFGARGNSVDYQVNGWSYPERAHTWTLGKTSSLSFPNIFHGEPLVLELNVLPHTSRPLLARQILRIFVNGYLVGNAILAEHSVLRIPISPLLVDTNRAIEISFEHPGYLSPITFGKNPDKRLLAICFFAVRLSTETFAERVDPLVGSVGKPRLRQMEPHPPRGVELRSVEKNIDPGRLYELAPRRAYIPNDSASSRGPAPLNFAIPRFYGDGVGGPAKSLLREGWTARQDAMGWTWSNAVVSRLVLPVPNTPGPHMLWIHMGFLVSELLPYQEITIFLEGVALGTHRFHLPVDEVVVAIPVPQELLRDRDSLNLEFHLPMASRPSEKVKGSEDRRLLAVRLTHIEIVNVPPSLSWLAQERHDECSPIIPIAKSDLFREESLETLNAWISTELRIDLPAFLRRFESLGNNCEFGSVSRKLGVELLQLFRFCGIYLYGLVKGLSDEFTAIADSSNFVLEVSTETPAEYRFCCHNYRVRWHTLTYVGTADPQSVFDSQAKKCVYLRRKFLEGMRSSKKIYVIKRDPRVSFEEASALLLSLNKYGRNTLLCIELSDDSQKCGTVEFIGPGLLRGYIGAFALFNNEGNNIDALEWMKILANAWLLEKDFNSTFRECS